MTRHAHEGKKETYYDPADLGDDSNPEGCPCRLDKNSRKEKLSDDVPVKHLEPPCSDLEGAR